jgi:hypothetical protein
MVATLRKLVALRSVVTHARLARVAMRVLPVVLLMVHLEWHDKASLTTREGQLHQQGFHKERKSNYELCHWLFEFSENHDKTHSCIICQFLGMKHMKHHKFLTNSASAGPMVPKAKFL